MARKLDKKKDFATVHGPGIGRYEQGGCIFDASGNEVVPDGAAVPDDEPEGGAFVDAELQAKRELLAEMDAAIAAKRAELEKAAGDDAAVEQEGKSKGRGKQGKAAGDDAANVDEQIAAQ